VSRRTSQLPNGITYVQYLCTIIFMLYQWIDRLDRLCHFGELWHLLTNLTVVVFVNK